MAISVQHIEELIGDLLTQKEIIVVEITVSTDNRINVTLDGPKGVKVEHCIEISRQIEHNLDRDKEDFDLEVSSAGIGRALKHYKQYEYNINRKVEVVTKDGIKKTGRLINVLENIIEIEEEPNPKKSGKNMGKKGKSGEPRELLPIDLNQIKSTKVVPDFGRNV